MSLLCSASLPHGFLCHQASLWRPNLSHARRSLCFAAVERPWVKAFSQSPRGKSAWALTGTIWGKITFLVSICPNFSHFLFTFNPTPQQQVLQKTLMRVLQSPISVFTTLNIIIVQFITITNCLLLKSKIGWLKYERIQAVLTFAGMLHFFFIF